MSLTNISRLSRLTAPRFKLKINGEESNIRLNDRLVSITVTLNNGEVSDHLSLEFDDRTRFFGQGIVLPKQGVIISAFLGYETYLSQMGEFIVNEVNLNGGSGGRTLSVSATPALLNNDVMRTWSNKTIQEVVDEIAKKHKLSGKVSPSLKDTTIDVVNQLNESDSAFLTRLAARNNAVFKTMAGSLLFMKKGEGTSASGKIMPAVEIRPHDVIQWSKSVNEQQNFTRVCAYSYDLLEARAQEFYWPHGPLNKDEEVHRLPHPYNNAKEALAAAKAKFDEFNREDQSLNLSVIGNPDITAEGKISLNGIRKEVDGDYIVKSVTHNFSQGGYQSSIQAYVEPKAS